MSEISKHRALGMTDEEYEAVIEILEREPTDAELAMYSVMWSEHCSYKSSRTHLKRFPSDAPWVVVGPGENAGVVDLGDGWLAAIRIESHNHPSFVEPYQGAATGVGGILRDILTMGARPIAVMDALRFGPLDDPRNRYLFDGVVKGVAGYGNAVGVPTVGGELEFDDCYSGNPLVNVLCLGLLKKEQLVLSAATGAGNLAVLLGNSTGRDGIGGASILASASFEEGDEGKRPSVQVGDPFEEKKLIEACLELFEKDLVVGIQDLGAAGIACATSETAAAGGMGMDVDLNSVPRREPGMTPGEVLMSESQERMLAIVTPERLQAVRDVTNRWDVVASVIGTVRPGGALCVREDGELVAEIPAASLSEDAPIYWRPQERPESLDDIWAVDPTPPSGDPAGDLLHLLADPAIGDPSWVYGQYDHMLFLRSAVRPGHDGSLLRIAGTQKALGLSVDGDGRLCALDPRRGAARLIWESALNVAVTGARPIAVVDNLNFGNPEKPAVMWQFSETIDGMTSACHDLGLPVIGGNVSFYNETDGTDIHPTPIAGVLGLAEPYPDPPPRLDRAEDGMDIWLVGPSGEPDFAASAYQRIIHQRHDGRPQAANAASGLLTVEAAVLLASICPVVHDLSKGGLAVAVTEISIASGVGAMLDPGLDWFGEGPHRIVVAVPRSARREATTALAAIGAHHHPIGRFTGDEIVLGVSTVSLTEATTAWRNAIPSVMT
ncbi:phosphoribosylformylglycinamidine synthase subunit PurL [bacterium]|nr:phosphoribosylformylglycinamidine synthase subunit PurL [bacterium]